MRYKVQPAFVGLRELSPGFLQNRLCKRGGRPFAAEGSCTFSPPAAYTQGIEAEPAGSDASCYRSVFFNRHNPLGRWLGSELFGVPTGDPTAAGRGPISFSD